MENDNNWGYFELFNLMDKILFSFEVFRIVNVINKYVSVIQNISISMFVSAILIILLCFLLCITY